MTTIRHVLLTGPPGVGKTTLIQKVCNELKTKDIPQRGFFTSELRESGRRIGFDVISLDGKCSSLARIGDTGGPKVGQYVVHVESFDFIALPILHSGVSEGLTVIDEIGKMELLSKRFEEAVKEIFASECTMFGTIPLPKGKPIHLVEFLRNHPLVKVIQVDYRNRDQLCPQITALLTSILLKDKKID